MDSFVESTIKDIREKVGDGKVLLALSGGVDSSVAAGLYPEPLESSLPAYSLTTVFSAKMREMKSRAYSDQMVSSI